MQAKQALEEMFAVVERRDAAAYEALFSATAVARHPFFPEGVVGRERIRAEEEALYQAFSDVRIEVLRLVGEDRTAAAAILLEATHVGPIDLGDRGELAATGRRIALPATWWVTVGKDGLVEAAEDYFDVETLTAQLGVGEQPSEIARRYFDEVVNDRRLEVVHEVFADDFLNHAAPVGQQLGTDALIEFFASLQLGFPDFRARLDELVPAGDRITVRFTFSGTHTGEFMGLAPTGRRVTMSGIDLLRVADGRIIELWGHEDWLGLLQQLGHAPEALAG